jgi:hypothetical protein
MINGAGHDLAARFWLVEGPTRPYERGNPASTRTGAAPRYTAVLVVHEANRVVGYYGPAT